MISRRTMMTTSALAGGAALLGRTSLSTAQQNVEPTTTRPPPTISVDADGRPYSDEHWDAPGEPHVHYTPVVTPNGWTLPYNIVDGVKVFHLVAEEVPNHEFAPGLRAHCWGYNGTVHGPTIEVVEGDRVRIYVTNRLAAPTTIHWHGVLLPAGMDGVGGLSQPVIPPGETYVYEFTIRQHGTHMYHSHHDEMVQMGMGLMGLLIIHPRRPARRRPDRDFAILLSEWHIPVGAARPNPNEMKDFNILTFNAKAFPGTAPLVVRLNDYVRIRLVNLSAMDHHPIHLHGHRFWITETDGGQIPEQGWWPETGALVPVGTSRVLEFIADNPGDWAFHCHMTHHIMNQMGHDLPNMIGIDPRGLDEKVRRLLPAYMTMGHEGMADMGEHIEMGHMPVPANSIPMLGGAGPFGYITMGGMVTILKVRQDLRDYDADPGWYDHPPRTVAWPAEPNELRRDGIDPDAPRRDVHDPPHDARFPAPMPRPAPHHHHH